MKELLSGLVFYSGVTYLNLMLELWALGVVGLVYSIDAPIPHGNEASRDCAKPLMLKACPCACALQMWLCVPVH